jgi:hypothetical protein
MVELLSLVAMAGPTERQEGSPARDPVAPVEHPLQPLSLLLALGQDLAGRPGREPGAESRPRPPRARNPAVPVEPENPI